jgi:hypothetical protein
MQAQQPVSIHITEKDGLPDNEFYNILEDSKGYIWLAADKGLFRFDGTEYKKFQHPEQIGLSVFQLKEDENGAIWYVNLSNQVFFIQDEKITLFNNYNSEFKGNLTNLRVANDLLILSFYMKIIIININTKEIVYKEEANLDGTNLFIEPSIYKNDLYFGIEGDLIKLDLLNFKKTITSFMPENSYFFQNSTSSIIGENLVLFVSNENGMSFYSRTNKFDSKITKLKANFNSNRIVSAKVIDNQIWYSTKNGMYVCQIEKDSLVVKRHLFPNQFVTDVVKDKHANYWFTTLNNSVFIVPNIEINHVSIPLIGDKIKRTQLGKNNELLISTISPAIYKYSFPSEKIQSFKFNNNPEIFFSRYFNNKYEVHTTTDKYEFNEALKITNSTSSIGSLKDIKNINSLYTLSAHSNYIRIIDIAKHKVVYKKDIRGNVVFYNAEEDLRCFATINGLLILDKDYKEEVITYNGKQLYINSITQTSDGVLWCSSFKSGLFAIKNKKVIRHITETKGLLSNTNRLIKATGNNLWIAGDNGIQYFNTKDNSFKNLTKNEGIVSYNYNGLEIIENNVFVSSPEQIIYFNEKDVFKPYNTPEVFFTNVSINNEKQELKPNYTLKEDASSISISYNAIGFKTNTNGQFEYRLLGLDKNWVETKNGVTDVQYNGLSEGVYTFQIRNITVNKTESKTKVISFLVYKPFWEKTWFFILIFLLVILTISLVYRRIIRNKEEEKNTLLKQLEVKNELIGLKLENLRSQMNPHFVFNALNSIQDYIINNQKNLAGDYLGKFADLMRVYLEQSNRGKITLEEEQNTLQKYLELEKLRFEDSLNYSVDIANNLDAEIISIPTMLVQPYVENALKHGLFHKKNSRTLQVSFSKNSQDIIQCVIEDNGIGRKKAKEINQKRPKSHKSFGLQATNKRLDLLNYGRTNKIGVNIKDLYDDMNNATGTRVVLTIPIIK